MCCVNCRHFLDIFCRYHSLNETFHVTTIILFSTSFAFSLSFTFHMSIVLQSFARRSYYFMTMFGGKAVKYLIARWFAKAMNLVIIVCCCQSTMKVHFMTKCDDDFAVISVCLWEFDQTFQIFILFFLVAKVRSQSSAKNRSKRILVKKIISFRNFGILFLAKRYIDSTLLLSLLRVSFLILCYFLRFSLKHSKEHSEREWKKILEITFIVFHSHCPLSNCCVVVEETSAKVICKMHLRNYFCDNRWMKSSSEECFNKVWPSS